LRYNIDIEFVSLIFLIVIMAFYYASAHMFNLSNKLFAFILADSFCTLSLNIITSYTISFAYRVPPIINHLLNPLFYLSQMLLCILFTIYIFSLVGYISPVNKRTICILLFPMFPACMLTLLSPFTDLIYYFDETYQFHHGNLYFLLYIFAAYFLCVNMRFVIYYRKYLPRLQFYTLLSIIFVLIITAILQQYYPSCLLSGLPVTLSIFTMYLTFQNPQSYIDKMTGLYERNAFHLCIKELILYQSSFDLLLIDASNLNFIYQHFGLDGYELLINKIAKILQDSYTSKKIFRIDRDRFALIVSEHSNEVVYSLQEHFAQSYTLFDSEIKISVNIGKAHMSEYASTAEDVLSITESAFSLLKDSTKDSYAEINKETIDLFMRELAVEEALRTAIEKDSFEVYFQPIISTKAKKATAAEALLRLNDPYLGSIPPDEFICIAEKRGLINQIGKIVLEKSCRFISENKLWKHGIEIIHVNLSAVQCMDITLCEQIEKTISKFHIPFELLNFEITETAVIESKQQLLDTMKQLSNLGITFAMDDYGSGYSNSQTLIDFPFDIIKFDKDLLWNCDTNEQSFILYRNNTLMMKEMGLTVIAEGAETKEQINMLNELGIDFIQGYYYSKPLNQQEFMQFIQKKNR